MYSKSGKHGDIHLKKINFNTIKRWKSVEEGGIRRSDSTNNLHMECCPTTMCIVANHISGTHNEMKRQLPQTWTFNDGSADDTSKKKLNGNVVGAPKAVDGIAGKALKFDGEDDGIKIPDSADINTGGPYTNRTIAALFNCDNVGIDNRKQVIFEEGWTGHAV